MVHKVLFWSGFGSSPNSLPSHRLTRNPNISAGIAVRWWQMSLEHRRSLFFSKQNLWAWPVFGGTGASFGYWLTGVGDRQKAILLERKNNLLDKRRRRAEREATTAEAEIAHGGVHERHVDVRGSGGQM